MSPFLGDRVAELKSWDDVKLLSVTVDRLKKWWRPGLICIGDAAHAMSPIGGVGINMAVQDAVAAANRLAGPLNAGKVTDADLQAIREAPYAAVAFHPMAAAYDSEADHQPRARNGERAAAEAAAVLQAVQRLSGAAPHSGAPARRRHPARARAHAGCRVGALQFSRAAAIPRRCGRGFRPSALRPRRRSSSRLPTASRR